MEGENVRVDSPLFALLHLLQDSVQQRSLWVVDRSSGPQIVERVHVAERNGVLLRDGKEVIALPFEVAAGIIGNAPYRRTEGVRLGAGDRLDRVRAAIHVADHPLLSPFPLRAAQFDMAPGVVFQFVAATHYLLGGVDAGDSDILFVTRFSPGLRRESPSDDKKCGLDAIVVEHVQQARASVILGAKQDIGSRAVVKGKGNEFIGSKSRRRIQEQKSVYSEDFVG